MGDLTRDLPLGCFQGERLPRLPSSYQPLYEKRIGHTICPCVASRVVEQRGRAPVDSADGAATISHMHTYTYVYYKMGRARQQLSSRRYNIAES